MIGIRDGVVMDVRPFSIHGDAYLELVIREDVDEGTFRVPSHAYTTPPVRGQRVRLTFLMGQVTQVQTL